MKMLIDSLVFFFCSTYFLRTAVVLFLLQLLFVVVGRKVLSMAFFIAVCKSFYVPPLVANYW